ncbi:MAG: peptidoglycan recognition family protein [Armatimonadota bacterium]|nr:peptidoglycan recognition protein family protein [Armatimonadota bacterium]MDW8142650.1 peptidoglycan recognition family protein [Armatimonadota bacterium]
MKKVLSRKEFLTHIKGLKFREWRGIVLHHTSKPDYSLFAKKPDCAYWLKVIDRVHRVSRKFKGIGYHFVIFPNGLIGLGRDVSEVGAHVKGHNSKFLGVCLLGNFNKDEMKEDQYISLWFVLTSLVVRLGLLPEQIWFHRDFAATDCPGEKLKREQIRNAVRRHIEEMKEWMKG